MLYPEYLRIELSQALADMINNEGLDSKEIILPNFNVEVSNNIKFGDLSSNIAMVSAKVLKKSPEYIANYISKYFNKNKFILKIEIIKPGFINFFFKDEFWHQQLKILIKKKKYNYSLNKKKICVEFVSANPTGLMHIGHARGAVLGDALCNILEEVGHDVSREYYINDAGEQIKKLQRTIEFHQSKIEKSEQDNIPNDLYPGDYLKFITNLLNKELKENSEGQSKITKDKIVDIIMRDIKIDLNLLNVNHENFVSEKKITSEKSVNNLKDKLKDLDLAYYGYQEKPKNISDLEWKKEEHLIFKSKKFGDDSDRALIKKNGELTYFMSDILYHQNKLDRKFDVLINIWGADHFGYVKRIKSALSAINKNINYEFQVKLTSMVNLLKKKEKIKMSKRSGNYITMREVLEKFGPDILRFMMISRSAEKNIDFDYDLLIKKSKDNPVFYIQYAYARCCSILNSSKSKFKLMEKKNHDLKCLVLNEEKMIIKFLCNIYNVIKLSAENYEPHRISNYLYELSKIFHNYWALGNLDVEKRIINDDENTTIARLVLVRELRKIIKKSLNILKIKSPENM